jgi:serine/threonine protein kinase
LEEYQQRFPELAARLELLFEVHCALEAGSRPAAASTDTATGATSTAPGGTPDLVDVPGFEILRELGRGGMSVVYQARQQNLNRHVALKVLLAGGFAGPEEQVRFRTEAEALGRLQHPHIVPVYEVGEQAGRPYLVMEFVGGGSLAGFLAGTPLPIRPAAQLVATLARAIHYAHQRGIVHRDLKPANVLMQIIDSRSEMESRPDLCLAKTAIGNLQSAIPKITDFGLAKLLVGEPGVSTSAGPTQSGAIIGTPSYMAPEQAAGRSREIAPAADIYALGAILYELLTGRPPFRAATTLETLLQVQTLEPVPPSRLCPNLPRDLATICLKCLEKEPRKRYGNAEALADDLSHFLVGEPIRARQVGTLERTWRLCRRNPVVAALTAAVAVTLLAGTGISAYFAAQAGREAEEALTQKRHADESAEQARHEKERAQSSLHFARGALDEMTSLVLEDLLGRQHELTDDHKKYLRQALANYEKFAQETGKDEAARYGVAQARVRVGSIRVRLGEYQPAVTVYRQALDDFTKLAVEFPATREYSLGRAQCHMALGYVFWSWGRPRESAAVYGLARDDLEKLVAAFPTTAEFRLELARCCHNLGLQLHDLGKRADARASYQQALTIFQKLDAGSPNIRFYRQGLASAHNRLGVVLTELSLGNDALAEHRKALTIRDELVRAYPREPDYRWEWVNNLNDFGHFLRLAGELPKARKCHEHALALAKELTAEFPGVPAYRRELARSHNNLGLVLQRMGDHAEAAAANRRSLDIREKLAADYKIQADIVTLGGVYCNLAHGVSDRGEPAAALPWYAKAIATLEPIHTGDPQAALPKRFLRNAYCGRAIALDRLKRHAEARSDWDRTVTLDDGLQRNSFRLPRALTLARLKEHAQATAEAKELATLPNLGAGNLYDLARIYALSAAASGDPSQSEVYAVKAIELLRRAVDKGYRNLERLKNDPDLNALGQRADFQKLLSDGAKTP